MLGECTLELDRRRHRASSRCEAVEQAVSGAIELTASVLGEDLTDELAVLVQHRAVGVAQGSQQPG